MQYWDIKNLKPDYEPAREKQAELVRYHDRLGKIAAREMRQRNRMIEEGEAVDRLNFEVRNGTVPAK
jgi:hypothetical protein